MMFGRDIALIALTCVATKGARAAETTGNCVGLVTVVEPSLTDMVVHAAEDADEAGKLGPGDLLVWGSNPICDVSTLSGEGEPDTAAKSAAADCTDDNKIGTAEGSCLTLPNGNSDCVGTLTFSDGTIIIRGIDQSANGINSFEDVIVGGSGCYEGVYGISSSNFLQGAGAGGVDAYSYDLSHAHLPEKKDDVRRLRLH